MRLIWLHRSEIPDDRWNLLVDRALNGLPTFYTWVLDWLCPEWKALVSEDWRIASPVCWSRKFRCIPYMQQAPAIYQMGILCRDRDALALLPAVLREWIRRFPYGKIRLNYLNQERWLEKDPVVRSRIRIYESRTYHLDLTASRDELRARFHPMRIRSLRKAHQRNAGMELIRLDKPGRDLEGLLPLLEFHGVKWKRYLNRELLTPIMGVIAEALDRRLGDIWMIRERKNGSFLSAVVLLRSATHLLYWLAPQVPRGKEQMSNIYLLAQILDEYAESGLLLDFSGSDIGSLQAYFRSWGAYEARIPVIEWRWDLWRIWNL